jgi:hypothetical protein
MKKNWTKRDPIKNYFPVPNEIYSLGLSIHLHLWYHSAERTKYLLFW